MRETKFLVDSNIWLSYFLASSEEAEAIIDSEESTLYTSVITLHEVNKKLHKMGYTTAQVEGAINFIKQNSIIVNVDKDIALASVNHCLKNKLHIIDALIYETSLQNDCTLVTADLDFKNMDKTKII